jgi:hypothetical protein
MSSVARSSSLTGLTVIDQHAFENLEDSAKDGIVDELINQGLDVFSDIAKSQWGSYCIQHSKQSLSSCYLCLRMTITL